MKSRISTKTENNPLSRLLNKALRKTHFCRPCITNWVENPTDGLQLLPMIRQEQILMKKEKIVSAPEATKINFLSFLSLFLACLDTS